MQPLEKNAGSTETVENVQFTGSIVYCHRSCTTLRCAEMSPVVELDGSSVYVNRLLAGNNGLNIEN